MVYNIILITLVSGLLFIYSLYKQFLVIKSVKNNVYDEFHEINDFKYRIEKKYRKISLKSKIHDFLYAIRAVTFNKVNNFELELVNFVIKTNFLCKMAIDEFGNMVDSNLSRLDDIYNEIARLKLYRESISSDIKKIQFTIDSIRSRIDYFDNQDENEKNAYNLYLKWKEAYGRPAKIKYDSGVNLIQYGKKIDERRDGGKSYGNLLFFKRGSDCEDMEKFSSFCGECDDVEVGKSSGIFRILNKIRMMGSIKYVPFPMFASYYMPYYSSFFQHESRLNYIIVFLFLSMLLCISEISTGGLRRLWYHENGDPSSNRKVNIGWAISVVLMISILIYMVILNSSIVVTGGLVKERKESIVDIVHNIQSIRKFGVDYKKNGEENVLNNILLLNKSKENAENEIYHYRNSFVNPFRYTFGQFLISIHLSYFFIIILFNYMSRENVIEFEQVAINYENIRRDRLSLKMDLESLYHSNVSILVSSMHDNQVVNLKIMEISDKRDAFEKKIDKLGKDINGLLEDYSKMRLHNFCLWLVRLRPMYADEISKWLNSQNVPSKQ